MLETEEVDEDYFTPVISTSLAEVFSRNFDIESANDSLKYVPPKPETAIKSEQSKGTQCVYACVLYGYQWSNEEYAPRGKLGFAIVKSKTGESNIVLYNSSKETLSQATISPSFEGTVKNNTCISYYDNTKNYWSMYGSEQEVKTIKNTLVSLNAQISHSVQTSKPPKEKKRVLYYMSKNKRDFPSEEGSFSEGSDIEPIKATRITNMKLTQHIDTTTKPLPLKSALRKKQQIDTSESEAEIDTKKFNKLVRLKTNTCPNTNSDVGINTVRPKKEICIMRREDNPTSVMFYPSSSNNDLPEKKLSNTELRKNMNKISEKMEELLNKVQAIDSQSSCNHNFQYEVTQKLLGEYEMKISHYQQCLRELESGRPQVHNELVMELQQSNKIKDKEIAKLYDQIQVLNNKIDSLSTQTLVQEKKFGQQILNLRHHVISDRPDSSPPANRKNITGKEKKPKCIKSDHIEEIVKTLMTEAIQTMFDQFEDDKKYAGKNVRDILKATVKNISVKLTNENSQ